MHSVKSLLNMDDDILIAHIGSGLTVAHMSVLTNQETSKVFVCGVKSVTKEAELKNLFTQMECKSECCSSSGFHCIKMAYLPGVYNCT